MVKKGIHADYPARLDLLDKMECKIKFSNIKYTHNQFSVEENSRSMKSKAYETAR